MQIGDLQHEGGVCGRFPRVRAVADARHTGGQRIHASPAPRPGPGRTAGRRIRIGTVTLAPGGSFPRSVTSGVAVNRAPPGKSRRTDSAAISPWFRTVTSIWNSSPAYREMSIAAGSTVTFPACASRSACTPGS